MLPPPVPVEPPQAFWASVQRLLDADRWSDALVTVRAFAQQTGQPGPRLTLGVLLYERGQRHHAVQEWTAVLEQAQAVGDWSLAAAAQHNLAALYRDIGDHRLARAFQQRALSLFGDCGPEELLQLGNDALTAGRWELAESLFQTVADLTPEDDPLQIDLEATQGLLAALRGDVRTGLRWLQRAYWRHCTGDDHRRAGQDLLNAAALLEHLGRYHWARQCVDRAGEHFRLARDTAGEQTAAVIIRRLNHAQRRAAFDPAWN
jgi:tetratricopeptide (TPR) repeat protein